jgi:hypothetical protein
VTVPRAEVVSTCLHRGTMDRSWEWCGRLSDAELYHPCATGAARKLEVQAPGHSSACVQTLFWQFKVVDALLFSGNLSPKRPLDGRHGPIQYVSIALRKLQAQC